MSGTLTDFDYYNPDHLAKFAAFIKQTRVPVLAICGAHQLVGMAFGADLRTLDDMPPVEKRDQRLVEYQYRFVKIVDKSDPIFEGVANADSGIWQDYTIEDDILRVWQNHGLKVKAWPGALSFSPPLISAKTRDGQKHRRQMIYAVAVPP